MWPGMLGITEFNNFIIELNQGSPNYGPRDKHGPRNHLIWPEKHFFIIKSVIHWRNNCWFGRICHIPKQSHCVKMSGSRAVVWQPMWPS